MIKTILVATDSSKHAEKAIALATDLAKKYQAHLVVTHALLRDASSETLRKIANRKALTKEQRDLLDNYEIDIATSMAGSGVDGSLMITIPAPIDLLEPIGQQIVDKVTAAAKKAGVKRVSSILTAGDPAEGILKTAKQTKADLIVLGTRGFGEIKGLLLGSVSHKVAQQAHCPVLTVK